MKILFITGASGVGKTSLISSLKDKYADNNWAFENFDSIGVPSKEDMIKEFGSIENWQKEKTYEWINRIINDHYNKDIVIFEGQVNPQFIKEGFEKNNFSSYKIILIDCSEDIMKERLENRKQPELFTDDMKNWLKYLREQSKSLNVAIVDTSDKDREQTMLFFEKEVGLCEKSEHIAKNYRK